MVANMKNNDFQRWVSWKLSSGIRKKSVSVRAKVRAIKGMMIECRLPYSRIGDLCEIQSGDRRSLAEIISFRKGTTWLATLGVVEGMGEASWVVPFFEPHRICCPEDLPGSILDGFGRSLSHNHRQAFVVPGEDNVEGIAVMRSPALAVTRPRIHHPLPTGLRVFDGLMTLGRGQRLGVFAGAGCGKTTLLAELARNVECDTIIFGLIGERSREAGDFINHELDEKLRQKTVLICATSDKSSMERVRAAFSAIAIAEFYARSGKHVLLILDSLTRLARAQREIGLALGEPINASGLPPSVYTLLPRLIERAGEFGSGSITGLYSVLMEKDMQDDPIAEEIKSLLDGHIMLSRSLAEAGHYPAVDTLTSLSRVMPQVVGSQQLKDAARFRELLAIWQENEILIRMGEYQQGSDAEIDCAISAKQALNSFLQQPLKHPAPFDDTLALLHSLVQQYPAKHDE
ncbi:FliI/YscN family ATPase [Cedecea sp.]|jgi:type III secretion protein N (ATPase)|uniref:FliI/YscN family ATPase n=1 Tax=Cedecea sp. TaxID=1970739 RepID=UPI0039C87C69